MYRIWRACCISSGKYLLSCC